MDILAPRRLWPALFTLALLLPASAALADTEGKPGRIVQMRINAQSSTQHASFHGRVIIRRPNASSSETYHWGGSMCPGQRLSDAQVSILVSAMQNRTRTLVTPRYLEGEGTANKCLVAFDLVAG
jgi:hypothetical protein